MDRKYYIYVIEAYGYSDFEKIILTHEEYYSTKEFKSIVKKARKIMSDNKYDYLSNLITCLKEEFGFYTPKYSCIDIGCNIKSKIQEGYME